jgi:hypothetical protein
VRLFKGSVELIRELHSCQDVTVVRKKRKPRHGPEAEPEPPSTYAPALEDVGVEEHLASDAEAADSERDVGCGAGAAGDDDDSLAGEGDMEDWLKNVPEEEPVHSPGLVFCYLCGSVCVCVCVCLGAA